MKSIKKSLKLINEKLGGTNDANDHFKSLIDVISDKIDSGGGGGGSDLPPVTSDDNGDVLTVVEGAWNKAAPSSGSDLPDVTAADNGDVLGVVNGEWDKMDKGWNIIETQLFSETVTTVQDEFGPVAQLVYSQLISADKIKVNFDGVEYTCESDFAENTYLYGGFSPNGDLDFSEYPFCLASYDDGGLVFNTIYTETAGTYDVVVIAQSTEVTPEFESVLSLAPTGLFEIIPGTTTFAEARDAFECGKTVYWFTDRNAKNSKAYAMYYGWNAGSYKVFGITLNPYPNPGQQDINSVRLYTYTDDENDVLNL